MVDDGTHAYLHAGGIQSQIDGSDVATYHLSDALGSTRGLADGTGALVGTASYDAFGEVRSSSGATSSFGYTGEQHDPETGFTYLRARYHDPSLGRYGVTLGEYREELGHNVPSVFVEFFLRPGLVAQYGEDGKLGMWERSPLLIDWTDTMGFPVAEPYWAQVPVGGATKWVLIQPFERRVLTYTPDNSEAFRVEMGNIGQHYKAWRHPDGTCRE